MEPIELVQEYLGEVEHTLDTTALGFSLKNTLLTHRRFKQAIGLMAELHHYSRKNAHGGGLLITGPSGVGKTTISRHYRDLFPRSVLSGYTRIPVVHVTMPSAPTRDSVAESILMALGDPTASRGSAEQKTLRIVQFFKSCEVELLILDEFNHICYAPSITHFSGIINWFKNLIGMTELGVVLFGLPEAELVIKSSKQLNRRFSARHKITPFDLQEEDDFREFRGLLRAFEGSLPIPVETPLHEANLARRFWVSSNGLIDYVSQTLEGAVSLALMSGHQKLDLEAYAAGFRKQVWSDVSDRLNPFYPESPLRPLTKPGEPFHGGDTAHMIGSPLARRLITGQPKRLTHG